MSEKRVVQDIVPSGRRTIRNVPPKKVPVEEDEGAERVPIRRAPPSISLSKSQTHFPSSSSPRRMTKVPPASGGSGRKRISGILLTFLIIFIGIAIIAIALSLLYSKAAVTITPRVSNFEVNGTFTAKKAAEGVTGLTYDTISSTQTLSQSVPAKEGAATETKAKGTATLYNEQTTQQKIVAGTRLANSDGKIYRTSATVTIPAGKAGVPGKVDVVILADQPGADYNMSLSGSTSFTIVAYKGTPKYQTVYARLKTAVTGGFAGTVVTVAPEVQKAAVATLKESLGTKLLEEVKTQVPKDSVLYPNAYTIDYETREPVSKGSETAEISVKGTVTAAVFKKTTLLKTTSAKELDKFPASTYNAEGIEDLKFTVVNTKDFSARKGTPLIFTLKGPVELVGTFQEAALKEELKGTYLKDSNAIFAKYPSIANAYALITPFWMRSFPNSPDKIIIDIKK